MELTDSGCLKVWLSEEDLAELGLTFESLDYEDPIARDAMKILLTAARKETGFQAEGGLMVEALPVDGGCCYFHAGKPTANPYEKGRGALCLRVG